MDRQTITFWGTVVQGLAAAEYLAAKYGKKFLVKHMPRLKLPNIKPLPSWLVAALAVFIFILNSILYLTARSDASFQATRLSVVDPPLRHMYDAYAKELGQPRGGRKRENNDRIIQTAYRHGFALFVFGKLYRLKLDGALWELAQSPPLPPNFYYPFTNRPHLSRMFPECRAELPPYGEVAYARKNGTKKEIESWREIGCRVWSFNFWGEGIHFQEFQNGYIIGGMVPNYSKEGRSTTYALIKDGGAESGKWHYEDSDIPYSMAMRSPEGCGAAIEPLVQCPPPKE